MYLCSFDCLGNCWAMSASGVFQATSFIIYFAIVLVPQRHFKYFAISKQDKGSGGGEYNLSLTFFGIP